MQRREIIPAYNPLQAPYIEVNTTVRVPGATNGVPTLERRTKYEVAPSAKKIATFIVNSIFGSELVTQTEGLKIGWLMPTLKEALEESVYQQESFVYINKMDDKIYLQCIKKNEIHDLVQKFDKFVSGTIVNEYTGIYSNDEQRYILEREILIEKGITYMNLYAYSVNKKNKRERIPMSVFNERTGSDYIDKYILPYEIIINVDIGQDFFKDSEKELKEEMVVINTIADEIEKTKTRVVTTEHYQSSDIVSNWKPSDTNYNVRSLTVGQLQDYFTLLPGDKDHQLFEFLQGDIRIEQYVSTFKFYDYQIIQMAGLSPASFGYEKDAYQNTENISLQKNASDMTIEAIKTQIEEQINKLIANVVKAQQSEGITQNILPSTLNWDYGENEKFTDMKKIQVLGRVNGVVSVPYKERLKIVLPILNKLKDMEIDDKQLEELLKQHSEEENINIEYGEI